jgi:hypothetical protein
VRKRVERTGRIESRSNIEAFDLRRLSKDVLIVWSEALWSIDHLDLSLAQTRGAMECALHQDLKMIPIFWQQREAKVSRRAVETFKHWLGNRFKATHKKPTGPLSVIDISIWISEDREHGGDRGLEGTRVDVVMFSRC